eukprot:CAMPEP_0179457796 /NCGR_PEP_ID=MMETSP0799-20121207/41490_1 /TAXON_ID=46947 /ORGANISM="Geminigera cryophila, Strain CCMP2564" /LENGTH=179 /DNA_ID=CAMNT_0021258693 /DNA_START=375 /DNA_END=911 /DNA_ORIENTATION=-
MLSHGHKSAGSDHIWRRAHHPPRWIGASTQTEVRNVALQHSALESGAFVPKFYVLNAENAASYANKNPVPADSSDVDPTRKLAIIVHGILGTGRNWVPFTRKLLSHFPDYQFILVDMRGHGESHAPGKFGTHNSDHTVDVCAQDLENLCKHLGCAPDVVIGHSFGGKVALHFHMMAAEP